MCTTVSSAMVVALHQLLVFVSSARFATTSICAKVAKQSKFTMQNTHSSSLRRLVVGAVVLVVGFVTMVLTMVLSPAIMVISHSATMALVMALSRILTMA